jgi:hypothetical protein
VSARGACTIENCGKPHYAHGLCQAHYTRVRRHGDPLGGGPEYGLAQRFLENHTSNTGNDCIPWPFAVDRKGYGIVWFRDHQTTANFAMCHMAHGEPPTPLHESAHSCGNGHKGCVNPNHLRWATRTENHADKLIHGTHLRGERGSTNVLSESDVQKIRASKGIIPQKKLSAQFGVTKATISAIQCNKIWKWLPSEFAA